MITRSRSTTIDYSSCRQNELDKGFERADAHWDNTRVASSAYEREGWDQ